MDSARDILVRSSSDESFEHIDPDFDNTYYPDLHGVATADYIPMEKDEVLLKKGGPQFKKKFTTNSSEFFFPMLRKLRCGCWYLKTQESRLVK